MLYVEIQWSDLCDEGFCVPKGTRLLSLESMYIIPNPSDSGNAFIDIARLTRLLDGLPCLV